MKIRSFCDAVLNGLDSLDFEDDLCDVLKHYSDKFRSATDSNDAEKVEKVCNKVRQILVYIRLFPIELKIAMIQQSYNHFLRQFLVLYLDTKVYLTHFQNDQQVFINEVICDIFRLLGHNEEASIWLVVANSTIFSHDLFLEAFIEVSLHKTAKSTYLNDQYIAMVWVLYRYLSAESQSSKRKQIFKEVKQFVPPKNIVNWLCHYFPAHGWQNLSDLEAHKKLFSDTHPMSFLSEVRKKIGVNGNDLEDMFSDCETFSIQKFIKKIDKPSTKTKTVNSINFNGLPAFSSTPSENHKNATLDPNSDSENTPLIQLKKNNETLLNNSHIHKKMKRSKEKYKELKEKSSPKKKNSLDLYLVDFYRDATKRNPMIFLKRYSEASIDK